MKKIFGELNITWPKIIIFAILIGIYSGIIAMVPAAKDTSFTDLTVTFEVWILFGILIITNSKSAKDSALKCFVFFLISQPLIYLVQDVINHSKLFLTYYKNWIPWTIATLPMGYIGYYMKKDKWWGLAILTPILLMLGDHYSKYLANTMFSFPRHILTTIFCISTLIIYPIAIFKNKKIKIIGVIISIAIIIAMTILTIMNPPIYKTSLTASDNSETHIIFDNTYKVYFEDESFGDAYIGYEEGIESWVIYTNYKKAGNVTLVLESPEGVKTFFDIHVKRDTYDYTIRK